MMPMEPGMGVISLGDIMRGAQGPEPVYANQIEIMANPAEFRLAFGVMHIIT